MSECAGEGVLVLEDVVRSRIACLSVVNATVNTLRTTPRPPAAPGVQRVQLITYYHRGTEFPNSVHSEDLALFVSPGDVEDAAYLAGKVGARRVLLCWFACCLCWWLLALAMQPAQAMSRCTLDGCCPTAQSALWQVFLQ